MRHPCRALIQCSRHPKPSFAGLSPRIAYRICGGRLEVRNVLYMACLSAIQHEPRIREFYRSLRARGKPGKVAVVAAMRKMLVILNARVRDAHAVDVQTVPT
ncbi:transposase [Xanthomonas campestris]|nr:transposase [Xanthomonas campestris]